MLPQSRTQAAFISSLHFSPQAMSHALLRLRLFHLDTLPLLSILFDADYAFTVISLLRRFTDEPLAAASLSRERRTLLLFQ
jgi:hypothetical protein